jgi:hypothetical protein
MEPVTITIGVGLGVYYLAHLAFNAFAAGYAAGVGEADAYRKLYG